MDTQTRKLFTMHRMYHPKADVEMLYVPRAQGGRGLLQLKLEYMTTLIGLQVYPEHNIDNMMQQVYKHH